MKYTYFSNDFISYLRSLLTGQDVKGNTPFHIAARMTGSLGTYLKEFVNLYSDKVYLAIFTLTRFYIFEISVIAIIFVRNFQSWRKNGYKLQSELAIKGTSAEERARPESVPHCCQER